MVQQYDKENHGICVDLPSLFSNRSTRNSLIILEIVGRMKAFLSTVREVSGHLRSRRESVHLRMILETGFCNGNHKKSCPLTRASTLHQPDGELFAINYLFV